MKGPQESTKNSNIRGQIFPYPHPPQRNMSQVDFSSPYMRTQLQYPNNIMWGIPISAPSYYQGRIPPPLPSLPPVPASNVPQPPQIHPLAQYLEMWVT